MNEILCAIGPNAEKGFKRKQDLKIHEMIHTNDKRHVCHWPGCQYRCISSGNLGKHLKSVHKDV